MNNDVKKKREVKLLLASLIGHATLRAGGET